MKAKASTTSCEGEVTTLAQPITTTSKRSVTLLDSNEELLNVFFDGEYEGHIQSKDLYATNSILFCGDLPLFIKATVDTEVSEKEVIGKIRVFPTINSQDTRAFLMEYVSKESLPKFLSRIETVSPRTGLNTSIVESTITRSVLGIYLNILNDSLLEKHRTHLSYQDSGGFLKRATSRVECLNRNNPSFMNIEHARIRTSNSIVHEAGSRERSAKSIIVEGGGCTAIVTEDGRVSLFGNGFSVQNMKRLAEMAENFTQSFKHYEENPQNLVIARQKTFQYQHNRPS